MIKCHHSSIKSILFHYILILHPWAYKYAYGRIEREAKTAFFIVTRVLWKLVENQNENDLKINKRYKSGM